MYRGASRRGPAQHQRNDVDYDPGFDDLQGPPRDFLERETPGDRYLTSHTRVSVSVLTRTDIFNLRRMANIAVLSTQTAGFLRGKIP